MVAVRPTPPSSPSSMKIRMTANATPPAAMAVRPRLWDEVRPGQPEEGSLVRFQRRRSPASPRTGRRRPPPRVQVDHDLHHPAVGVLARAHREHLVLGRSSGDVLVRLHDAGERPGQGRVLHLGLHRPRCTHAASRSTSLSYTSATTVILDSRPSGGSVPCRSAAPRGR